MLSQSTGTLTEIGFGKPEIGFVLLPISRFRIPIWPHVYALTSRELCAALVLTLVFDLRPVFVESVIRAVVQIVALQTLVIRGLFGQSHRGA